jgi:chromosome segregation ATPase
MNVSNDKPAMDYVQYFTEQLPQDLARMAKLRDELTLRQGAISAVSEAVSDREAAAIELSTAKESAKAILAEANAKSKKSVDKLANAEALEKDLDERIAKFEASASAREKVVAQLEQRLALDSTRIQGAQVLLDRASEKLNSEKVALESRIKAFQDKVASITA